MDLDGAGRLRVFLPFSAFENFVDQAVAVRFASAGGAATSFWYQDGSGIFTKSASSTSNTEGPAGPRRLG